MDMNTEATTITTLARLVDCFDEEGFAKLAGVKLSTLDAWRKRGKGPEYVLLGRTYLYPIAGVQSHLTGRIRGRSNLVSKRVLL